MRTEVVMILAGVGFVVMAIALVVIAKSRVRVDAGHALVITKLGADRVVTFTDAIVLPIMQRADLIDLSVKRIVIRRQGKEGLICRDNIRADAAVTFTLRINRTVDDVLRVIETIGAKQASDAAVLEDLFAAKFSEALKTVAAQLEFAELFTKREQFKDQVIMVIGKDLGGFYLEDAAIDYLEQTPIEVLDPSNVLDAQGIRKIRELTKSALQGVDLPSSKTAPFAQRLVDQGLFDIGVAIEVACSVTTERMLAGRVADHRDALSRLVAPSQLEAIADAELTCREGRATVRFATYATEQQVLDAARLVHALKQDSPIFR